MIKKAKYIYIDDENDASVQAITDGLNDTGIIEVTYEQVTDFNSQITYLAKKSKSYHGIILDLRLDQKLKAKAQYTAPSLAQEIRLKSSSQAGFGDLPIILCSTEKKIKIYNREQTSHDLFDYEFLKSDSPDWNKIAKRLDSLARGYNKITPSRLSLESILGRETNKIDQRVLGKFLDKGKKFPKHEIAQHVMKELIRWPGPMIGQDYLAARLGIDIGNSPDWENLLNKHLVKSKYTGVFSEGWDRWWVDLVREWFRSKTGKALHTIIAEERVACLKGISKLKHLTPASPLPKSVSSKFSTICEAFNMPLDSYEGFKVFSPKEPKPWQEYKYLSVEAILERVGFDKGLKPHPSDAERIQDIKDSLTR